MQEHLGVGPVLLVTLAGTLLVATPCLALPPPGASPPQPQTSPPVVSAPPPDSGARGAPRTDRVVDSPVLATSLAPLAPPPPRYALGVSGVFFREAAVALGPILKYQHPFPNGSLLTEGILNVLGSGRMGSLAIGAQPRTPRGSFSFTPGFMLGIQSFHVATGCPIMAREDCSSEQVVYSGTGPFGRLRLGFENRTFALSFHLDLAVLSLKARSSQRSSSEVTLQPALGLDGSWWL